MIILNKIVCSVSKSFEKSLSEIDLGEGEVVLDFYNSPNSVLSNVMQLQHGSVGERKVRVNGNH